MAHSKKRYTAPRLIVHGSVEEITGQTSSDRTYVDYAYPAGTHRSEMVFSGPPINES